MPYAKKITETKIRKKLREIIDSKDKAAVLKAISLIREIEKEKKAEKQTQRGKVTELMVNEDKLQKLIEWKPFDKQKEVLASNANEIVICAGRQGGKSILCAYVILRALLQNNMSVCLIAPTYDLTDRVRHYLKIWLAKYFPGEMRIYEKPFPRISTKWGSSLECKSAEQPDQILGKGYDLIIVDECARIDEKIYETYIVPASGTKLGKYFFISTPRGRNWFWKAWRKAKENNGAFYWTSLDNPNFTKEKWEQEEKRLPEMVFRQEYKAEFLEDFVVFKGFEKCIKTYEFPQKYNPDHLYFIGIDLGKYDCFTAISVIDRMTNQEVAHYRFQGDWAFQKERIISIADEYPNSIIWVDTTSITSGDVYVDELANTGYNVNGYKIQTNLSKKQLIEKLVVLIQNQSVFFPDDKIGTEDSQEANTECRAYEFEMSPSGNIIYRPPQGEYDDCVMARALACWELDDKPLQELKKGQSEPLLLPQQEF